MQLKSEFAAARRRWAPLTLYQKFEDISILILTGLIAIVIVLAIWNLALKILFGALLSDDFDPTNYEVFQAVFGMILTVIIALEFKRSILVLTERRDSIVQVRAVILIALLAIVRKLIILDIKSTEATQLLALAAAVLALGGAYWLIQDQDRRRAAARAASTAQENA